MQVYAEYALAENFCMDFALLYCAKAACKNPCGFRRIALASALGAGFAVVFPLFGLGAAWGIVVKILSGAAICAVAGKYSKLWGFIKFSAVFAASTFVLGGALIALFTKFGVSYEGGDGYLLSSVPVGIPLFCAVVLMIIIRKAAARIGGRVKGEVTCIISLDGKRATCAGFYDSGNKVYCGGVPVSMIPKDVAEKIIDARGIKTFVDIHTVAGKGSVPVFRADSLTLCDGQNRREIRGASFGIAPDRIRKIVLHSDISEVN